MTAEEFLGAAGVSRETLAALQKYVDLLAKWQASVNLVSAATLAEVWERHILDSAQLSPHLTAGRLVDFGSGAGFPGLVLAIMRPDLEVHLIESDQRKCVFLREAARVAGAAVTVHSQRVGEVSYLSADMATARALAPLAELLDMQMFHVKPAGLGLYLKGREARSEVSDSKQVFEFKHELLPSRTSPDGAMVRIENLRRRE
jgi:16S rRNA (guanine527-N7)-methyltransferase